MGAVTDIATIAAPAATALLGGYAGSRWQARTRAEEDLRTVLDGATEQLEQLAEATARLRSGFIQEGARATSDATRKAIGDHEEQSAKKQVL